MWQQKGGMDIINWCGRICMLSLCACIMGGQDMWLLSSQLVRMDLTAKIALDIATS